MKRNSSTKKACRRLAAFVLSLTLPLAGFTWGQNQEGSESVGGSAACLPSNFGGGNNESPGQIERGSELATMITKRKKVRVLTPSGEIVIRQPALFDGGIEGDLPGSARLTIPWTDIQRISVQKRFTVVGGVVGMAAGALFGFGVVQSLTGDDADPSEQFTGAAALAVLGALPGLFLGSVFTRWKTVYTAPPGAPPTPRISLIPMTRGGMAFSLSLSF